MKYGKNMNYYDQYQNFGMHRNVSHFSVLKGEWKKIINWDVEKISAMQKRKGYTQILDVPSTDEVLSLIPFELGDHRKLIRIDANGDLYCVDPVSASDWGSPIKTGLDTSARWDSTTLHDSSGNPFMVLGNGVDVFKTADGVTFSTISGVPLGKYWTSFQERVYCAGVPADEDVLHWSSIGDLTDWSSTSPSDSGSQNIDKHFAGNIKGIDMINDRVVVWKQKSIKRWDEDYLRSVMSSNGLEAPYALAKLNGMAFTLDRDAIRLYDGNTPVEISSRIEDLIFGIPFTTENTPRICGEAFKRRYYLSVGDLKDEDDITTENAWIVYDYNKNEFWLYSLATQATAMTSLLGSDGVQRLYFGDGSGKVYEMFNGSTDDGTTIECRLESHKIYPDGVKNYIEPRSIRVASDAGKQISVQLIADDKPDNSVTIGDHAEAISENLTQELGNAIHGITVIVTHESESRPVFYGFTLGYDSHAELKSSE
jgi:hypothetical protein